jgi:hypothetical protein
LGLGQQAGFDMNRKWDKQINALLWGLVVSVVLTTLLASPISPIHTPFIDGEMNLRAHWLLLLIISGVILVVSLPGILSAQILLTLTSPPQSTLFFLLAFLGNFVFYTWLLFFWSAPRGVTKFQGFFDGSINHENQRNLNS